MGALTKDLTGSYSPRKKNRRFEKESNDMIRDMIFVCQEDIDRYRDIKEYSDWLKKRLEDLQDERGFRCQMRL